MMCTHLFEVSGNTGLSEGANQKEEATGVGNSGINSEEQGRAGEGTSPNVRCANGLGSCLD